MRLLWQRPQQRSKKPFPLRFDQNPTRPFRAGFFFFCASLSSGGVILQLREAMYNRTSPPAIGR